MIRRHHCKTTFELLHDKPPDLSYLHVFGALYYPTNDSENLGKLQPKADIGIFIGYAPTRNFPDLQPTLPDVPLPIVNLQAPEVIAPIPEAVAPEHAMSTRSFSSTSSSTGVYDMLSSFLKINDFSKGSVDPTEFILKKATHLILYKSMLDDIILLHLHPELCDLFAKIMCSKFKMSMMRKITFFLRLQISQSPRGIFINQSKYALESLKKYGYESCDPVDTPMVEKSKLDEDKEGKACRTNHTIIKQKKARESKPKLYDGNTILKMDTIVIPDSDETLMLCEESRTKMLLKEQDPLFEKHRVNTKPINYAILYNDYYKEFVRQSDLYSEHAYWKATSVLALDPSHSSTTIIVEVPKELPKVSMVNNSLKELKCYLTGFDQVVKERTTATAITEGTWGFEHTKACFRDEIIPFIKELKDIFNNFNQYLVEELADVQKVFYQMEQAVEQHRLES
ncbi:integrase, catalytic region, zinc finger, CCHC-type containing protein, partial [Tanacetum coccineum]